jgi:hypothetical protein
VSPGPEDFREPFSGHDRATELFVREESGEADRPMEVEVHDDRTRELESTSMSRMRLDWAPGDQEAIEGLHEIVSNQMLVLFGSAYQIMNDIYWIVRTPQYEDGTVLLDPVTGYPLWEVTESGGYLEDYSLLTNSMMKEFLFKITVRLFDWEQKQADLWGDSMFAKAQWEQAISRGFEQAHLAPGRSTVEDRTQQARRVSREERLMAIFRTLMSKKADAVVRSTERLAQRLKDVVTL